MSCSVYLMFLYVECRVVCSMSCCIFNVVLYVQCRVVFYVSIKMYSLVTPSLQLFLSSFMHLISLFHSFFQMEAKSEMNETMGEISFPFLPFISLFSIMCFLVLKNNSTVREFCGTDFDLLCLKVAQNYDEIEL